MTALATPFRGGALDEDAYRALVRQQLAGGTAGLVPCGTTGEAVTMTSAERVRAVRVVVEEAKGRVPVVAGAGSNSTAETIEAMGRVREVGADAALIVTPYYNKPNQAGLLEHYRACVRAHPGFPIVVYNVPGRTGGDILPETMQRLCELDEIVAIKEATASMIRAVDLREKCGARLTLLSGRRLHGGALHRLRRRGRHLGVLERGAAADGGPGGGGAAGRAGAGARAASPAESAAPAALRRAEPHPGEVGAPPDGHVRAGDPLPLVPLGEPHRIALATELRRLGLLS